MNTELIASTWRELGERQARFISRFYEAFFARHPRYRPLFPPVLREAHLAKMAHTVALLADLSDERADIAPHLRRLAASHRPHALAPRDFGNFREVFLDVLGEELGPAWNAQAERAWQEAFDEVLIPALAGAPALTTAHVISDIPNMKAQRPTPRRHP